MSGDKPAICITEPGAGSAATEISTRADHKGDRYILNGTKHWITGGGVSKFHLIFARVFENEEPQGIAGFIVLQGTKGLKVGTREPAMGLRGISGNANHLRRFGSSGRNGLDTDGRFAAWICRVDECLQRPACWSWNGSAGHCRRCL